MQIERIPISTVLKLKHDYDPGKIHWTEYKTQLIQLEVYAWRLVFDNTIHDPKYPSSEPLVKSNPHNPTRRSQVVQHPLAHGLAGGLYGDPLL
jgi:hypothetical protein